MASDTKTVGQRRAVGEQEIYWEDGKRKRSVYSADADEPLDFACGEQENCIDLTYKDFGKMVETIGGKFQERMSVGGIWLKDYPGYFKITPFVIRFFEQTLAEYQARPHKPSYIETVGDELGCYIGFKSEFMEPGYDWISDRLGWFVYWMKWAYRHCQKPIVCIS